MRPYKGYSTIRMYISDANGNYNSLQTLPHQAQGQPRPDASATPGRTPWPIPAAMATIRIAASATRTASFYLRPHDLRPAPYFRPDLHLSHPAASRSRKGFGRRIRQLGDQRDHPRPIAASITRSWAAPRASPGEPTIWAAMSRCHRSARRQPLVQHRGIQDRSRHGASARRDRHHRSARACTSGISPSASSSPSTSGTGSSSAPTLQRVESREFPEPAGDHHQQPFGSLTGSGPARNLQGGLRVSF